MEEAQRDGAEDLSDERTAKELWNRRVRSFYLKVIGFLVIAVVVYELVKPFVSSQISSVLFLVLAVSCGLFVSVGGRREWRIWLRETQHAGETEDAKRERRRFRILVFAPVPLLVLAVIIIPSYYQYAMALYVIWGVYLGSRLLVFAKRVREETEHQKRNREDSQHP
jgi:ABC-type Fe3+ transport system permease subunit